MKTINLLFVMLCLFSACKKKEEVKPEPPYNCGEAYFSYTIDNQDKSFFVCSANASSINSVSYYGECLTIKAGHITGSATDTTIILNIFRGNAVGTYSLLATGSTNTNNTGSTVYTIGEYYTYLYNATGQVYKTNNGTSGTVNITKYDGFVGGFTQGNFTMTVKNISDGTIKDISGTFRLKIKSIS